MPLSFKNCNGGFITQGLMRPHTVIRIFPVFPLFIQFRYSPWYVMYLIEFSVCVLGWIVHTGSCIGHFLLPQGKQGKVCQKKDKILTRCLILFCSIQTSCPSEILRNNVRQYWHPPLCPYPNMLYKSFHPPQTKSLLTAKTHPATLTSGKANS